LRSREKPYGVELKREKVEGGFLRERLNSEEANE